VQTWYVSQRASQWFAAKPWLSDALQATLACAQVPVAHRSIVRAHACRQVAVVFAHARRHAASLHAASHDPHWLAQVAPHAVQPCSQSFLQASLSSPQGVVKQACSNGSLHANTSSSPKESGSEDFGVAGTNSQSSAIAATTRGSLQALGHRLAHARVSVAFFGAAGGAAGAA
jgi:hypothetical protein